MNSRKRVHACDYIQGGGDCPAAGQYYVGATMNIPNGTVDKLLDPYFTRGYTYSDFKLSFQFSPSGYSMYGGIFCHVPLSTVIAEENRTYGPYYRGYQALGAAALLGIVAYGAKKRKLVSDSDPDFEGNEHFDEGVITMTDFVRTSP